MDPIPIDALLQLLIARWHDRVADLPAYLWQQFGFRAEHACDRLILVRMADGNLASRNIGRDAHSRWEHAAGRLRQVPLDHEWRTTYDTDPSGELYLTHSFLFFVDGGSVLLSERFGPNLIHRVIGEVRPFGGRMGVDWKTVWCTTAG